METIKIKIEKLEKINEGILYLYYRATNINTNEVRTSKSESYYGDDIINLTSLTEQQLMKLPIINGKRYGSEVLISSDIKEYSEENGIDELKNEGWNENIHNAIAYVMY
jgi:hypothetical protein